MIGEEDIDIIPYRYYVYAQFEDGAKKYFFGTDDESLKNGDRVVVQTTNGLDIAILASDPITTAGFHSPFPMSPVLRKTTLSDEKDYEFAKKRGKDALNITKREVASLGLPMNLLDAKYNLECSKCVITYTADNRVDFRELLKVLAPLLRARIDLRQIAPRDKAKQIGGMGSCGLPLCCSTFLNEFAGIGIAKAKNQMLSLNIPKLSGACGKLKCCLDYEDDIYTEEKKRYPHVGNVVTIKGNNYRVDSFNIVAGTIKLASDDNFVTMTLEEFNNATNPKTTLSKPSHNAPKQETDTPLETATQSAPQPSERPSDPNRHSKRHHQYHGHHRPNNGKNGR